MFSLLNNSINRVKYEIGILILGKALGYHCDIIYTQAHPYLFSQDINISNKMWLVKTELWLWLHYSHFLNALNVINSRSFKVSSFIPWVERERESVGTPTGSGCWNPPWVSVSPGSWAHACHGYAGCTQSLTWTSTCESAVESVVFYHCTNNPGP